MLEGKDDEDAVDALLHPAKAAAFPGPELGTDEPENGDAGAVEVAGKAEIDFGKIDQDGEIRAGGADGVNEAAVAAVDAGDVAKDLGDAHNGDIFGADGLHLVGGAHFGSAEAGEVGLGKGGLEGADELGAVVSPEASPAERKICGLRGEETMRVV